MEVLHASNIIVQGAKFLCRIKGEAEMPVKDVTLTNIQVKSSLEAPIRTENVLGFLNKA